MDSLEGTKASLVMVARELEVLYQQYPEDVAAAVRDAAGFVAGLVDDLAPGDEPWSPITRETEK